MDQCYHGVTRRCRLSWLTNSALVYESKCGGREGVCGVSANEYSCSHHVIWSPNKLWRSNSILYLTMSATITRHLSMGSSSLCSGFNIICINGETVNRHCRLQESAGILEQSMGARNRAGNRVVGPPTYVARRAGTTTLFL